MYKRLLAALVAGIFVILMVPAVASASSNCYASGCTGQDPTGTGCVTDGKTIGSMDVQGEGMLELRWSRKCNASWGRFSAYTRSSAPGSGAWVSEGRVTAWNPGQPSQSIIGSAGGWFLSPGYSWWTSMVDGSVRSCTGVEVIMGSKSDTGTGYGAAQHESKGWTWGPCVD